MFKGLRKGIKGRRSRKDDGDDHTNYNDYLSPSRTAEALEAVDIAGSSLERTDSESSKSPSPSSGHIRSRSSPQSTLSIFGRVSLSRARELSQARRTDPLGLNIIWEPETRRALDIIFVHGLGGTSRQTWSKHRDPELFWPHKWLPQEPNICNARVLSFGYNAHFGSTSSKSITNINDFAKDLLYSMKFGKNKERDLEDLDLGKVPIIFVVHSMGGLVVKKAYILAQNDEIYMEMADSVRSILFLATPHRGANLAELLNKILSASIFNHSPKQYISDLRKNSPVIEEMNEQFRNLAPKLELVSFYETLATPIGGRKIMILEKASAILGYPHEVSKPLDADHHNVCKYTSQQDPNYVSVRDMLKTLVGRFQYTSLRLTSTQPSQGSQLLEDLLAISERPDDDLNFFYSRCLVGTCQWILSEALFINWLQGSRTSRILWINAVPGSGKTIMGSFIINHLKVMGLSCQFFFFRFGDQTKRSMNLLLRSLAFQIAQDIPSFRRRLNDLSKDGLRFEKTEAWTLWQKLFVSVLFKIKLSKPLYWVIDAVDESDSPDVLFNILSSISSHNIPICVLVLSWKTQTLSYGFERLAFDQTINTIKAEKNTSDMRFYVEESIKVKHWTASFKKEVSDKIIEAADGNFLWVTLALKEVLLCHTSTAIHEVLQEIPTGMESLYKRMETTLANSLRVRDRALAKKLLVWASCSRRVLNLIELADALEPEFPIMDLKGTILDVCGQFVVVDDKSQVALVHRTARDYLMKTSNLPFSITLEDAHQDLFKISIAYLMNPALPNKIHTGTNQPTPVLLSYVATSWMYHLSQCSVQSENTFAILLRFLRGQSLLIWIQSLAVLQQLTVLISASKTLITFSEKARKKGNRISALIDLKDLETLDFWAVDLVKIIGKFGGNLLKEPESICSFIPQFCPRNSIIYRQFGGESSVSRITVTGLSNEDWDDSVAKISTGRGCQASMISCAGRYFAILISNGTTLGTISLWNSSNFEEVTTFQHGENVSAMCFSTNGRRFVSYGFRTMKVWAIPSGRMLVDISNPLGSKALAITFAENNTNILTGSDDKVIRKINLNSVSEGWQVLVSLGEETISIDGAYTNSPCFMAFNPDATQIAVAYRGFPLSVWGVDDPRLIGMCKRVIEKRRGSSNVFTGVDRVSWNPLTGGLLGIYNDGCVFKWHPTLQKSLELRTPVSKVQCSPNGASFATCDNNGTIRLWDYQSFALLFHLSCDEPVIDFVFSPDCRRLYDLRGAFCNVWEPNVLARISEIDEHESDLSGDGGSETVASKNLEESVMLLDAITVLSSAPSGSFYCTGNEEGVVELFDCRKGKIMPLWRSSNNMLVDTIVWSNNSCCIAAAGLGGNVTVKSVASLPSEVNSLKFDVKPLFDVTIKSEIGGVQQLLLCPNSTSLLIVTHNFAQVWSIASASAPSITISTTPGVSSRWVNHPLNPEHLLVFDYKGVTLRSWDNLQTLASFRFNTATSKAAENFHDDRRGSSISRMSGTKTSASDGAKWVDHIVITLDRTRILVETSSGPSRNKSIKNYFILSTHSLVPAPPNLMSPQPAVLSTIDLPAYAQQRIDIPLRILSNDRLVFLDRDFWICTIRLGSNGKDEKITRHFFLPRDWLNAESLDGICMMADGTLLCPKNGEVAVVHNDLEAEW